MAKNRLDVRVSANARVQKEVSSKERAFLLVGGLFNTLGGFWLLSISEVPAAAICLTVGIPSFLLSFKRYKKIS